jgi:hypothetical protein
LQWTGREKAEKMQGNIPRGTLRITLLCYIAVPQHSARRRPRQMFHLDKTSALNFG